MKYVVLAAAMALGLLAVVVATTTHPVQRTATHEVSVGTTTGTCTSYPNLGAATTPGPGDMTEAQAVAIADANESGDATNKAYITGVNATYVNSAQFAVDNHEDPNSYPAPHMWVVTFCGLRMPIGSVHGDLRIDTPGPTIFSSYMSVVINPLNGQVYETTTLAR